MLCESAELAPELFGQDKPFGGASERPPSGKRPRFAPHQGVSGSPVNVPSGLAIECISGLRVPIGDESFRVLRTTNRVSSTQR
eukprot:8216066-Alexandrium_andersonii.AAC.1